MQLKDLIERGYFPKELPPPFNTSKLANNVNSIISSWAIVFEQNGTISSPNFVLTQQIRENNSDFKKRKKEHANTFINKFNSSKPIEFSISKGKLSRRFLRIPNPKHFIALSEKITNNWALFENVFRLSPYSQSLPVPEKDVKKRSVHTKSKKVSDFRNQLIETSFSKLIEIRVDISKFYPSIYTHSVTWGFLGKEKAKNYFHQKDKLDTLIANGDIDAKLYKIADEIDTCIRSCQERQSIGIPIGPDTSHIIAELIACRIDYILKTQFESINLKACRYYDDYYLFVSTKDEADKVLKGLQKILIDFQLEVNESKIRIKEFPFSFEDEFALVILQFDFKGKNIENSIKHYFSLIWGLAEKNPFKSDSIFKYALRRFEYRTTEIPEENWKLFESLLLKTALIEPSILDIVTRILLSYQSYLNADSKVKLKELIQLTISSHSSIKHNFEVSWALWLAKTFEIEITESIANCVIDMKDAICLLVLLDISKTTKLIQGNPTFSKIESELNSNILFSEYWLLAYEGVKKGWLTPSNANFLDDNHFFKILKDLDVEFYDTSKQLHVYEPKNKDNDEKDKKININYEDTGKAELTKQETNVEEIEFFLPLNLY